MQIHKKYKYKRKFHVADTENLDRCFYTQLFLNLFAQTKFIRTLVEGVIIKMIYIYHLIRLFTLFESADCNVWDFFREEMVNEEPAVQATELENNKVSYCSTAPNNACFSACALLSRFSWFRLSPLTISITAPYRTTVVLFIAAVLPIATGRTFLTLFFWHKILTIKFYNTWTFLKV